jgi:hypothetical protein
MSTLEMRNLILTVRRPMASALAAIVIIAFLTVLLVAVRSKGEIALSFRGDIRQSRLLWSSVSICAAFMWVVGAVGAFASMSTPAAAAFAALLVSVASAGWWLALGYADRELERESPRTSTPDRQSPTRVHGFQADLPPSPGSTHPPSTTGNPPPGWYADPWKDGAMRRWNGLEWTMDTRASQ